MKLTDWQTTDNVFIKNFDKTSLLAQWDKLHQGDLQSKPDEQTIDAWLAFHNGHYHQAAKLALSAGPAALPVLLRTIVAYTDYICEDEKTSISLLAEAYQHAENLLEECNDHNAIFTTALCIGRYAQNISIVKALKKGLGNKVKSLLTQTLEAEPNHGEAHIALAMYHAEIIDKVGSMLGGLTYGASADEARKHIKKGLEAASSPINLIEAGNAYLLLDGEEKGMSKAIKLYKQAAKSKALDCLQAMDIDFAIDQIE